ncbi:MAG: phosphoribosylglycinamide formyltransferase [Oscillospiraceae bacterium]|nr:phosphoribosylglycinamide formyltransferase [Oscillospiraceae bacterium]
MKKVAVLVSGGGTNLQALIDADIDISLVISSNPNAYAIVRAENNKIKTEVVSWAEYKNIKSIKDVSVGRARFSEFILKTLRKNNIDLVVLAGFMIILTPMICKAYHNAMINVHPSLLPSFAGKGFYGLKVHEAALARGVKLTGATVHFVNEICDGGKIIMQKAVEVKDGDTPESLQKRVMEAEREILPEAVKLLINGNKV